MPLNHPSVYTQTPQTSDCCSNVRDWCARAKNGVLVFVFLLSFFIVYVCFCTYLSTTLALQAKYKMKKATSMDRDVEVVTVA